MKALAGALVAAIVVVIFVLGYVMGVFGFLFDKGKEATFTVEFEVTPVSGQTYQFNSTVSGGLAPYSYFWDFGDDAYSRAANPQHTYMLVSATTAFTVSLLVLDNMGISRTASKTVTVVA